MINADGTSWNLARFRVKNHLRQFLPLVLPGKSALVRLVVAGVQRRPAVVPGSEASILVPLPKGASGDISFFVDVYFMRKYHALSNLHSVSLEHPRTAPDLAAKLRKIYWTVRAPAEFEYYNFSTDMDEIVDVAVIERLKTESEIAETKDLWKIIESEKAGRQEKRRALENIGVQQSRASLMNEKALSRQGQAQREGIDSNEDMDNNLQELRKQRDQISEFQRRLDEVARTLLTQEQQRLSEERDRIRRFKSNVWEFQNAEADRRADEAPGFARALDEDQGPPLSLQRPAAGAKALEQDEAGQLVPRDRGADAGPSAIDLPSGWEYETFCFYKEGNAADLSFSVVRKTMWRHLGVLARIAGFALLVWLVHVLGLLRIEPGEGLSRGWMWPIVIIVAGAVLASGPVALFIGAVSGVLLWMHYRKRAKSRA